MYHPAAPAYPFLRYHILIDFLSVYSSILYQVTSARDICQRCRKEPEELDGIIWALEEHINKQLLVMNC